MLKKITLLGLFVFLVVNCRAQSIQEYIKAHVEIAKKLMHDRQIPASIVLGVAIHESAAGKSKIAKHLNNHFGVKGKNSNTEIKSAYRDYESVDESFEDFADFITRKPAYNKLFDLFSPYDYKNWARGIARGGYAHSGTWASQVIALIKKYELYQYDERPAGYLEPVVPVQSVKSTPKSTRTSATKSTRYTVKKGDNLNKIAKKFGTTAAKLMHINNLSSSNLQPGQKLQLK